MTEVIQIDPAKIDRAAIDRAAARLRAGGLVAFPTETVYGLGAHALDRVAVRRIFTAKRRPANDPLIVHVASSDGLAPLVIGMPEAAVALAHRFWPGPLTLVVRRAARVPGEVTAGLDTVAIRIPAHPIAHALLEAAGIPIAAPSANLFSRPSPTTAAHVLADLDGRIDMVIDGGATDVGVESTVVDLTRPSPVVLRPGAIGIEMLRTVLADVRMFSAAGLDEGSALASPGLLTRHYSPRAPLTLYEGERAAAVAQMIEAAGDLLDSGLSVAVLVFDEDRDTFTRLPVRVFELGPEQDPAAVARRLYAALRECDAAEPDAILLRTITTPHPLTGAIRDRMRRAAAGRVVAGSCTTPGMS